MSGPNEISELEQAYFQLEQIKKQVNALSEFLSSKMRDQHKHAPKTTEMIDPRTQAAFRSKKRGD